MHSAPSVIYPVGRSRFLACLQAVLCVLGGATVAAWSWRVDALGWRQALAVAALLGAAGVAVRSWRRMAVGSLRWDGQQWFWLASGEPSPVRLHVHLDLQRHMLLCLHAEAGTRLWCWAEKASQPQRWIDLRRAVYSPASPHLEPDTALSAEP